MNDKLRLCLICLLVANLFTVSMIDVEAKNGKEKSDRKVKVEDGIKEKRAVVNASYFRGANYEGTFLGGVFNIKIYSKDLYVWNETEKRYVDKKFKYIEVPDINFTALRNVGVGFELYDTADFDSPTNDMNICYNPGTAAYYKTNETAAYVWVYASDQCVAEAADAIIKRMVFEWDISSIDDGASISDVDFEYDGAYNSAQNPRGIYAMANQPSVTAASSVWTDTRDGTAYLADQTTFPVAANNQNQDLGTDADSDLEGNLGVDWFAIGVSSTEVDTGDGAAIWTSRQGGVTPAPTLSVEYTIPTTVNVLLYVHTGVDTAYLNGSSKINGSTTVYNYYEVANLTVTFLANFTLLRIDYNLSSTTDNPFYLNVSNTNWQIDVFCFQTNNTAWVAVVYYVPVSSVTLNDTAVLNNSVTEYNISEVASAEAFGFFESFEVDGGSHDHDNLIYHTVAANASIVAFGLTLGYDVGIIPIGLILMVFCILTAVYLLNSGIFGRLAALTLIMVSWYLVGTGLPVVGYELEAGTLNSYSSTYELPAYVVYLLSVFYTGVVFRLLVVVFIERRQRRFVRF